MSKIPRIVLYAGLLGLAWAATIALGMRVLARNADVSAPALAQFPKDAALNLASDRPTLVLLADPSGANTRQSLNELAQLMSASQGKMKAYVLFARPAEAGANWTDTDVWREAASIPGVVPVGDEDGRETRRFGGETSGQTMLFAADGRLLLNGGIVQSESMIRDLLHPRLTEAADATALVAR